MDTDEGLYHAKPQTRGKIAHETVDNKTASNRKDDLLSLPVYSGQYKLMGKVDVYRKREKLLIERAVRTAFNRKQFSFKDFVLHKGEYRLKIEKNTDYTRVFFDVLIPYKMEIFQFVRSYYRCFMQNKEVSKYPKFEI